MVWEGASSFYNHKFLFNHRPNLVDFPPDFRTTFPKDKALPYRGGEAGKGRRVFITGAVNNPGLSNFEDKVHISFRLFPRYRRPFARVLDARATHLFLPLGQVDQKRPRVSFRASGTAKTVHIVSSYGGTKQHSPSGRAPGGAW